MKKTTNLGLSLYESEDKFTITSQTDSLNANMEIIDNAISSINNEVGQAVLFTEQTLTEEQKAQVRTNIGIKAETEDVITEDVQYFYDGDIESGKHEYVEGMSGYTPFVKIASLPDNGKIDLVNGNVSVKGADVWVDYSFDITQDMLSQSVEKTGISIPAVIPNKITQILYQHEGLDSAPWTYVVICEQAGRYDIAFETWYTNLYFPTPGVYLMDGRSFGRDWYVDYLNAKIVYTPKTENRPTDYAGNEIQLFHKGICIGDSITEGYFEYNGGNVILKDYSYPTFLNRMTGVELINSGVSGFTSKQWYDASVNSESIGGKWVNGEWVWNLYPEVGDSDVVSSSLDYSDCDFAIIHLGINDTNTIKVRMRGDIDGDGQITQADVDILEQYLADPSVITDEIQLFYADANGDDVINRKDVLFMQNIIKEGLGEGGNGVTLEEAITTFETSINGIIANLKASSKGIKVFLATIIPYHSVNDTFEQFNAKIREIAEQTSDVYLLDLTTYSDCYGDIYGHGYHLTALGYRKMASEISAYISYIISQNLEDFKWVQFIGTDYSA